MPSFQQDLDILVKHPLSDSLDSLSLLFSLSSWIMFIEEFLQLKHLRCFHFTSVPGDLGIEGGRI